MLSMKPKGKSKETHFLAELNYYKIRVKLRFHVFASGCMGEGGAWLHEHLPLSTSASLIRQQA